MILSIVIPVYNVEKYVYDCLESVVSQVVKYKEDCEILVINDGSQDDSLSIIRSFDWRDCNVAILNQDNQGLSATRNKGISLSKGDYLWFVDSDDIISPNAIEILKNKIYDQDLIYIGHTIIQDDKHTIVGPALDETSFIPFNYGTSTPAQFIIYKRSFLIENNLFFIKGIYHEDTEFTPRCAFLARKIGSINDSLYDYQIRSGSIMTTNRPKRAFDCLIVAKSLITFSYAHGLSLKNTPMNKVICLVINNALDVISKSDPSVQNKWLYVFNKESDYIKVLCSSSQKKYKIEGAIMSLFPKYIVTLYKMLIKLKN